MGRRCLVCRALVFLPAFDRPTGGVQLPSVHVAVTSLYICFLLTSPFNLLQSTVMSFFRRKEMNLIPPVDQKRPAPSSPAPSYGSTPPAYGSNEGSYNQKPSSGGYGGNYEGGGGGNNPSRGGAPDPNRSELFSGYNKELAGPNRFTASDRRPELREPAPGEENEEDVEGIKQQIRATKQESVNSTRNALRLAREAEETARGTLLKLGDQSGTFFYIRHHCRVLIV